jgi:hypothetical protein
MIASVNFNMFDRHGITKGLQVLLGAMITALAAVTTGRQVSLTLTQMWRIILSCHVYSRVVVVANVIFTFFFLDIYYDLRPRYVIILLPYVPPSKSP